MTRRAMWASLLALALVLMPALWARAQGGVTRRPVSGPVMSVDMRARLVQVGPMTFFVPAEVPGLEGVGPGSHVVIRYTRGERGALVATEIRLVEDAL